MNYEKLYNILIKVFPTCHNDWAGYKNVPDYPYIAILDEKSDNFSADSKVYYQNDNFTVELYAPKKNYIVSEKAVEKAFNDNDIFWNKQRIWLEKEKVFQTIYEI